MIMPEVVLSVNVSSQDQEKQKKKKKNLWSVVSVSVARWQRKYPKPPKVTV